MSKEHRAMAAAYLNLMLAVVVLGTAVLEIADTVLEDVVGVDVRAWHGLVVFAVVHSISAVQSSLRRAHEARRQARETHKRVRGAAP